MRPSTLSLLGISLVAWTAGCGGNDGDNILLSGDPGGSLGSAGADGSSGSNAELTGAGGSKAAGTGAAHAGSNGAGGSAAMGGLSGSGGSNGRGGSAGSGSTPDAGGSGGAVDGGGTDGGGAPTHVVGTCSGLAAAGVWEKVTPPSVTTGILHVLADPVHTGTVYLGTANRGIFKSTNCGAAWTKINTGRNAGVIDSGGQWSMEIDPIEPSVLYAGSLYGSDLSLQKSTNGGVDWDSVFPPGSEVAQTVENNFFQEASLDPTDHRHLVVSFHSSCKGNYAPMCMAETKDSGNTWRLFKGPVGGWGENARPLVLSGSSFLYATWADGLFFTGDGGATWSKVGGGGNHQIYRTKGGVYYLGDAWGMNRSTDGRTWTKIDGAPGGDGLIGDGTRLFTGYRNLPPNSQQPYFTASETDGTKWTSLASPNMAGGPVSLATDTDHHVLYSANFEAGAWRVVTQ